MDIICIPSLPASIYRGCSNYRKAIPISIPVSSMVITSYVTVTDRYWAGLFTDLVIEQVLMSIKTVGQDPFGPDPSLRGLLGGWLHMSQSMLMMLKKLDNGWKTHIKYLL